MFTFKKQHHLNPIKATIDEYTHDSGLSLLYIKPTFKQKDFFRFEIIFKTLPEDPSGLPHITEHIVLNGSKKYPIKDVFFEVFKYAVTRSLNASTYNHKTTYYFNTPIYKEFVQLMEIYLDAVLAPLITDESVYNEGVSIKQTNKGEIKVSGVVYNEMLGAFNSAERVVWTAMATEMFKDFNISWGSGGYPPEIVNVTPQKVREFHKKFYNLSNAVMYIYGNQEHQEGLLKNIDVLLKQYESSSPKQQIEVRKLSTPVNKHEIREFKYQAMSEHAKFHSLVFWNLSSYDIAPAKWYILLSIIKSLFSSQCGWIGKKLKQDKIIQTYVADIDEIAIDLKETGVLVKNISEQDFEYVYRKIVDLFREAVNDPKKLMLNKVFKRFKESLKDIVVYKDSPYVSNFVKYFIDNYTFKNADIETLVKDLFNITLDDFENVAKLLQKMIKEEPFEFRFVPDKDYVKNLKEESVINAKKLVAKRQSNNKNSRSGVKVLEKTEKPLIVLSSRDVKPKLPDIKHVRSKKDSFDFYSIPMKEKYRTQLQVLLNVGNLPRELYTPFYFYYKQFGNPILYKTSYKNVACNRTDAISVVDAFYKANYANPLNIKYYLSLGAWTWRNQEKSALNILKKATTEFTSLTINTKVLKEKLKAQIKNLLESDPGFIEQGLVMSVLTDRVPFFNISRYMAPGDKFLEHMQNHVDDLDALTSEIIEGMFKVHKFILKNAKPVVFLGTPRYSKKLESLVTDSLEELWGTGNREDTIYNKTTQAQKENIKKIGLSSGYMRIFGIADFNANSLEEGLIRDLITDEIVRPIIRFELKAYGGMFYYNSDNKYWQIRAYRIPTNVSFEELQSKVFNAIQKFNPTKELIERYKRKVLGSLFIDSGNVFSFYRTQSFILNEESLEDVKREIRELKAFNVTKFKEIQQKIVETEDIRLVGVI